MSESKRLAAHRAAASAADVPAERNPAPEAPGGDTRGNEPTTTTIQKEPKMDDATKAALDAARNEGREAGTKAANERMNAVFASEHYAGREGTAAKMLAKPGLSAEDIIDLLADSPKTVAPAASEEDEAKRTEAAQAAARDEMKASIEATGNSDIDTGSKNKPSASEQSDAVWDRANAKVDALRKGN